MTTTKKLYRIIVQTTHSKQPGRDSCTHWNTEVLYCGYDLDEARRVYHASTPLDYSRGYGGRARQTVAKSKRYAE